MCYRTFPILVHVHTFTDAGGGKEGAPATMFFADGLFSAVDGRLQLFSGGLSFQALGCLPIIASMGSEEMESSTVESAGIIDVPGERGLLVLLIKVCGKRLLLEEMSVTLTPAQRKQRSVAILLFQVYFKSYIVAYQ